MGGEKTEVCILLHYDRKRWDGKVEVKNVETGGTEEGSGNGKCALCRAEESGQK